MANNALLDLNNPAFQVSCEQARSIVLDQNFFALDSKKYKQFTELLDAPVSENIGLARLMNVVEPWSAK